MILTPGSRRLSRARRGSRRTAGLLKALRSVKDPFEIEKITEAARLLDRGFTRAMKVAVAGAVEMDAAFSIESFWRRRGAEGLAFDTIIASGSRGALPHGKASEKKIKKGELIVVDMGVLLERIQL